MTSTRTAQGTEALLEVKALSVSLKTSAGYVEAVRGVSFSVGRGEVLGLVGESGSGKSITMRAVMGLLPSTARISGSARYLGEELINRPQSRLRRLRGSELAMIFQDPMTALNPVLTVGDQIVEAIRIHDRSISEKAAISRCIELLRLVSIPFPEQRIQQYPHEFSGGMRQRVTIAMAMANSPKLLIADEPTTALDVTVQAQILEVLNRLRAEQNVGLIVITHDLGVVAGMADRVAVMYAGQVVESGPVDDIFYRSHHPYTEALMASLPSLEANAARLRAIDGSPPTLLNRPSGCAFHPRCSFARPLCAENAPTLRAVGNEIVACNLAEEVGAARVLRPMKRTRTNG